MNETRGLSYLRCPRGQGLLGIQEPQVASWWAFLVFKWEQAGRLRRQGQLCHQAQHCRAQ